MWQRTGPQRVFLQVVDPQDGEWVGATLLLWAVPGRAPWQTRPQAPADKPSVCALLHMGPLGFLRARSLLLSLVYSLGFGEPFSVWPLT